MTPQRFKNVFLVINKFAGHQKRIKKAIDTVKTCLQEKGCNVHCEFTQYPGHATRIASEAIRKEYELIVAVGGDGTVNEIARAVIGTQAKMGIIPAGSGNGLARELGIPMNLLKSTRSFPYGSLQEIDVCRINDQAFFCTCGIGFDAQIALRMNESSSRGFIRYILLTIRESLHFKSFSIKMKMDGVLLEKKVFLVTFANISQFGNHAYIAPHARVDDGLLDVIVIKPFSRFWLPVLGILLFTPVIPCLPFVEYYKVKEVEILHADTPIFHFDGEIGRLVFPSVIKVDHSKLSVIAGKTV
jgi:diacylglycerol kinase (ATP)